VWFGTVTIDDVEANLFGPSYIRGISIRDELDKRWLAVRSVRLDLAWDGLTPRVVAAGMDGVDISPQFVNGRCTVPFKPPPSEGPLGIAAWANDLKDVTLTVRDISIAAVNEVPLVSGGGVLRPDDHPNGSIVLGMGFAEAMSNITIPGVKWQRGKLTVDEIRAESRHGKVDSDLYGAIQDDGSVILIGQAVSALFNGETCETIESEFRFGGYGRITVAVTGTAFSGPVQGEFKANIQPDAPVQWTMEGSASKTSMAELTRVFTPDNVVERGTAKAMVRLGMSGFDTDSLKGNVAFFLDDADVWRLPILSALFKHMKLKLDKADVQASFNITGTLATVRTGQLGTLVWAADFLEGGTVDFKSGKIDGYAVFVPIKQAGLLRNVFKAINPLRLVTDEVFRLHVTGTTDKAKVTPEPFSKLVKLSAGTVGLLQGVAKGGGQLTGDVFKAVFGKSSGD